MATLDDSSFRCHVPSNLNVTQLSARNLFIVKLETRRQRLTGELFTAEVVDRQDYNIFIGGCSGESLGVLYYQIL